jgi:hypothetical protein
MAFRVPVEPTLLWGGALACREHHIRRDIRGRTDVLDAGLASVMGRAPGAASGQLVIFRVFAKYVSAWVIVPTGVAVIVEVRASEVSLNSLFERLLLS